MIFFYLKNILFFDRLLQNPLFIRHFVTRRYLISQLKDFSKIYQLKGLKPKNKGHMNFYECCDLTEKVYLLYILNLVFKTI